MLCDCYVQGMGHFGKYVENVLGEDVNIHPRQIGLDEALQHGVLSGWDM